MFCPFLYVRLCVCVRTANAKTRQPCGQSTGPLSFSPSGSNDLLAKCVYSVFSHYYPQYDPCTKGLMAENFPPARLHRKIIDHM